MSKVILRGSPEHQAHLNGVAGDECAAKRAESTASKKADLRKKIADANPSDKQALIDQLDALEKSDVDYVAGFRAGVSRGNIDADVSQETKDGYLAGMAAGKEATADKPKSDIQGATSPAGAVAESERRKAALETNPELSQDGPTVQQYVSAGRDPKTYPPKGFASKSTQAEIDAAIAAYKTK
jgi:hypothetical protein